MRTTKMNAMVLRLTFASAIVIAGAPALAAADLLVHYNMDENTGVIANDLSGNAHTGTFTSNSPEDPNPVRWDAAVKPSLAIANTSSVRLADDRNTLTTPDSADLDGLKSFTLMMWVNGSPANNSGFPMMVWKYDSTGTDLEKAGFTANWETGGGSLWLTVGGASSNATHSASSNAVASLSGWHHWAVTYDGTNMSTDDTFFYLDGNSIGSGAIHQSTTQVNALDMYVASRGDVADRAQRQLMDEFRFYGSQLDASGALSQSQIQAAMTAIPEPASLALIGLGGTLMLSRRRQ